MQKQRKKNRKKEYDYNEAGSYFITTCTKNMGNFFGEIKDFQMVLSPFGNIVENCWKEIPSHFKNVELDEFVVMPNHFHGILHLLPITDQDVGTNHGLSLQKDAISRMNERLPNIIKQFKSSVTRFINKNHPNSSIKWQRSYYDRIIRNEKELHNIRSYIFNNPTSWIKDKYYF